MMLKRFIAPLKVAWRWLIRGRRWRVERNDDEPEVLQPRVLYLVGEREPWVAVFKCPCGCHQGVRLNLLKGHRPLWTVTMSRDSVPTVSPSINRQVGCRSHFFVMDGRVKWC